MMISQWWSKLSQIGIREEHLFGQKTAIKLINVSSAFSISTYLNYIIFDLIDKDDLGGWIYAVGLLIVFGVFYLQAKAYYTLAKYIFFLSFIFIATSLSVIFGSQLGSENVLFVSCIFAVFCFDKSYHALPIVLLCIVCFFIAKYAHQHFTPNISSNNIFISASYYPNVIAIFLYLYIFTNLFKKNHVKYEEEIKKQKNEITLQKEELFQVHKQLTDSVRYAKRIQTATLPTKEKISTYLDYFIFYQPKDIVSGDFYWFARVDDKDSSPNDGHNYKLLIVCGDCTGHGVPGAFMTMIANALLYQIVNEENITEPREILQELNRKLVTTLRQDVDDYKINDGMDIGICLLDKKQKTMKFAGSKHSLIMLRNQNLIEISGSRSPIGGYFSKIKQYEQHIITYQEEDIFYLFTDGYADQFGGDNNKRFNKHNFKLLLTEIHTLPLSNQKYVLENRLQQWQGIQKQIDDILVIGFKP
ncbi:MAG: hypothetical protein OHK0057_31230 [Thermoflexibacter sp.]